MKYKFILFSPWLLKSPVQEQRNIGTSIIKIGYWVYATITI